MLKQILLFLTFSLLLIPSAHAEDVYRDCINLVTDYAYYRDRFDADGFASLFTEDATLTVVGQTWNGRDEIRQRIAGMNSSTTIRHLMSTIRIVPLDEDHATGVSYATIYSTPADSKAVEGFAIMGEYHDEFLRTPQGWKIRKRTLHNVFDYVDQN